MGYKNDSEPDSSETFCSIQEMLLSHDHITGTQLLKTRGQAPRQVGVVSSLLDLCPRVLEANCPTSLSFCSFSHPQPPYPVPAGAKWPTATDPPQRFLKLTDMEWLAIPSVSLTPLCKMGISMSSHGGDTKHSGNSSTSEHMPEAV